MFIPSAEYKAFRSKFAQIKTGGHCIEISTEPQIAMGLISKADFAVTVGYHPHGRGTDWLVQIGKKLVAIHWGYFSSPAYEQAAKKAMVKIYLEQPRMDAYSFVANEEAEVLAFLEGGKDFEPIPDDIRAQFRSQY